MLNFSDFCKKTLNSDGKDIFMKSIIRYTCYSKFATFTDFEKKSKLFSKKPSFFFQKTPNLIRSRSPTSVAFYGKLVAICDRNFSWSEHRTTSLTSDIINWQKRKKKHSISAFRLDDFLPILNMGGK